MVMMAVGGKKKGKMDRRISGGGQWYIPIIPALWKLRQDGEFKANLHYILRPSLKKKKKVLVDLSHCIFPCMGVFHAVFPSSSCVFGAQLRPQSSRCC
jgi:glutathione synthase/RimK-type ligase-like ATP-grasp enzyme